MSSSSDVSEFESQHPGAQAANGARGDLQHPDARVVHAHLGMDRAVGQTKRGDGPLGGIEDRVPDGGGLAGGRQIDGFLEKRPVERIGLVE
jgi:hypothetical protein